MNADALIAAGLATPPLALAAFAVLSGPRDRRRAAMIRSVFAEQRATGAPTESHDTPPPPDDGHPAPAEDLAPVIDLRRRVA
ncbi:hypothetical protein [Phaeacidiphilus oryzae]|uniref:hypothetical protein n=1 Tax=Phaeacidiphilus oryzae TaxID=348818 RepID=UPI0005615827|nr:hypothetical protein [Phaeacidiphilus oryzae]